MPHRRDEGNSAQPAIRRLNALRELSDGGVAILENTIRDGIRHAARDEDLIQEGDPIDGVRVLLSGWLCRYKVLEDGRRQIVSFVLPGDSCDAHAYWLGRIDHSISALTPAVYAEISRAAFEAMLANDKSIAEAFWCETLINAAVQREWVINLGRRSALERVAHLLCELYERLRIVGLVDGNSYDFPVTQTDAADAVGLSGVHMNRMLQELRGSDLIVLRGRTLTINDHQTLKNTALFSADYLHCHRAC
ncbi:MAG: Crp/Fnr family transcriptional regulator [Bradyrhizobium sp.]|uniref:Crp/Fnr family transcriptional regulator n=1 Tax=Bradyrhizobium sp. TaxID=376 RepID=UPI001C29FE11|nr:Crp/Fnr family transcriptional regulator [Bradyrhizobium sp.]MBU6461537.1 Crp/Fnr family transcriptional regulator [Pseudomonadota bacterium]MDE2066342.1 Crp/Fnr family transcriptional regulator [Bradyrhizobium sp.]MDE2241145.1 Crp/Fnr family transcriptional regulator [Bradyrhizobium sp.]MDE2471460.1 Crp/Fnr family transcriptional regulator [Bradyrhizobium sp.]